MIKRALARRFGIACGIIRPRADEMVSNETKPPREEMWTLGALDRFVKRHPEGGTFWSKSRRTVRSLRTLHPRPGVVVAIMREKAEGARMRVYLFVKNGEQMKAIRCFSTAPNLEQDSLLKAFSLLPPDVVEEAGKFISVEASRI